MRMNAARRSVPMALAFPIVAVAAMVMLVGPASAAPQVTLATSNPHNNQSVTISGSGFPVHSKDPTGVQILECSDPSGSVANLPTTPSSCDGATIDPLPIYTDANGAFTAKYTFNSLDNAHGASNINCNAVHFCVLWVGVDYNQQFLGTHAFSTAFRVGGQGTQSSSSNTLVIVLPIVAAAIIVGALVALRRRRIGSSGSAPASRAGAGKPRVRT